MCSSYVIQSIAHHRPSSEGTAWEYEVKWKDCDKKNTTWELQGNMTKVKEMVKEYWKEIGGQPKAKRKMT